MVTAIVLVPALPLAGALVLLLFGKRLGALAGVLATSTIGASFFAALIPFGELLRRAPAERVINVDAYDWAAAGALSVSIDFQVDPLSAVMVLVVTGVGTLIHAYSIGYMAGDPRLGTYFAYLNLFAASMLILVLADNFVVLYVGWELVGLCSFLLISFWHHRPAAAAAGKKAFIVNRIGDLGFLIGILLIYRTYGTLDFLDVFNSVKGAAPAGAVATAIPLLLFVGAAGKSAQIPLHVWLPDAMEGPTPVSALIHAATMVTAGVYLVARAHVLFEASHAAGLVVATIGIATALFAALIATAQDDLKRVLAYSTISQLGYMFLAVGVGALTGSPAAYAAAIFHLVTHAFFKALLFLGAGSVMHCTGEVTDMKRLGGLRRVIPVTSATFFVGWLAILGIPPLSGFFSKDAILAVTWESGYQVMWMVGIATAALTAFYMSRQVFLTFFGESRLDKPEGIHESPGIMTLPLRILALLAAAAGILGLSVEGGRLLRFLSPVFPETGLPHAGAAVPAWVLALSALVAAAVGLAGAYNLYLARGAGERRASVVTRLGGAVALVRNKFYVDELYGATLVWPARVIAGITAFGFDARIIDGAVDGVGTIVTAGAGQLRRVQSGSIRRYVLTMLAGIIGLAIVMVVQR